MIEPSRGNEVPDKCVGAPPLPQLVGDKPQTATTGKKPQWDIVQLILPFLLVCASTYGFLQSGVMSHRWFALPTIVLVPTYALIVYQVIVSIRRLLKAKKENAE